MTIRLLSLVIALFLVGAHECSLAEDHLSSFKSKCTEYGFAPGSEAHAQCVQKLDSEGIAASNQGHMQQCSDLKHQVDYWCSDTLARKGMNGYGALQCGKLTAAFRRDCAAPSGTIK
jgi:hypothetical protein